MPSKKSLVFALLLAALCGSLPATGQVVEGKQKPTTTTLDEAQARNRIGQPAMRVFTIVHAYEPTEVGYTVDQADDNFLDFQFSLLLPFVFPSNYPRLERPLTESAAFSRPIKYRTLPRFYFAMTERQGQYIWSRDSAPVVNKRFNPAFGLRWWGDDRNETEDNYFDLVYAHESNGQHVASPDRFAAQIDAYLKGNAPRAGADFPGEAYRSARDNISRGWDYIGVQYSRDWDVAWPKPLKLGARARFNYYLRHGVIFQHDAEDYRAWEKQPDGKLRKAVDGVSLRLTAIRRLPAAADQRLLQFLDRSALILTSGYSPLFKYGTVQLETGFSIKGWPILAWYRYGYNMDLIDYYHKNHSFGLKLSIWKFDTP